MMKIAVIAPNFEGLGDEILIGICDTLEEAHALIDVYHGDAQPEKAAYTRVIDPHALFLRLKQRSLADAAKIAARKERLVSRKEKAKKFKTKKL